MRDLLYLKDDQIKEFIEQIFYAYRETYSDPKKILKKHSFGTAHHRAIHIIEKYEGITVSGLLNKLKAYELQESGMDTVEANIALGFNPDERDYGIGAQILRAMKVKRIKLLSKDGNGFIEQPP